MKILVLNAGSSSQKSCLYDLGESLPKQPLTALWHGMIDWSAQAEHGVLTVKAQGHEQVQSLPKDQQPQAIATLLNTLVQGETAVLNTLDELDGVGHRVVHGGREYSGPTLITDEVTAAIARLIPLAPNHNPAHLAGIETIAQLLPTVPQVAVFDTAFHSQMPLAATLYPIPYHWYEKGIQRYGFHGISHEYCAHRAAQLLGRSLADLRLVTCHLGNGCSMAAIKGGRSINTTMGFTPLEGLMMGSRSGSIDPAIPIALMRQYGLSVDEVDTMLNKASGLQGILGTSGDLRSVLAEMEQGNDRATLAWEMYVHRLVTNLGAMVASLGGVDGIIFTAGIGENSPLVRQRVAEAFGFLGVALDEAKNADQPVDQDIATAQSSVRVLVIHTEEDWAIAQSCWRRLQS